MKRKGAERPLSATMRDDAAQGRCSCQKLHGGTRVALHFKGPVPVSGAEKASRQVVA